jgi:hypothetical protein
LPAGFVLLAREIARFDVCSRAKSRRFDVLLAREIARFDAFTPVCGAATC